MPFYPPESIKRAIDRLPHPDHPLIKNDFAIWYLGECREIIDSAISRGPKNICIEERIIDLDPDEFKLMKQTSFCEDPNNNLVFGWRSLRDNSIWGFELNDLEKDPNHYAYWKISSTLPKGDGGYKIVFIESDTDFNYEGGEKRHSYSRRMLAILSKEELTELIAELGGQEHCVRGDVETFIEGSF